MSAPLSKVPPPSLRVVPGLKDIQRIPLARAGEFELNEREVQQTRRLVYSINKQHQFLYRTMRQGSLLLIWRIK